MSLLKGKLRQLRVLVHKRRIEDELDEELAIHIELETEKNIREGMSPVAAKRAALVAFGGVEQTKEGVRDARWTRGLEDWAGELRLAVRTLGRSPGFTSVVVLTLALAIGANTAIFTVLYDLLIRPLDVGQPERVVAVTETRPGGYWVAVAPANYVDWTERNRVFDMMAACAARSVVLTGGVEPVRLDGVRVSGDYFAVLGIRPLIGRTFTAEEQGGGSPDVAVLSHAVWAGRFGADTTLVGRTITLDGHPTTVVGVMPPHFQVCGRGQSPPQVWRPNVFADDPAGNRSLHHLRVIARLAPATSLDRARADMASIARALEDEYPENNEGFGVRVTPLRTELTIDARTPVLLLGGAMALVLLIGCVNVANLMFARATSRAGELAMRKALGASRARLARQLLTEAGLLALGGGGLGLLLAFTLVPVMVAAVPDGMPRIDEVGVGQAALAFTLAASIVTALLVGAMPAMRGSSVELPAAVPKGSHEGMGERRARSALVAAQLAFTFMLLTGTVLMLSSFARLTRVPRNYDAVSTLVVNVPLPQARYAIASDSEPATSDAGIGSARKDEGLFTAAVLERLRSLPVVEAAVAATRPPGTSVWGPIYPVRRADLPPPREGEARWEVFRAVSAGYFETLRVPVRSGRVFSVADDGADVAVISQSLARELWPEGGAVGERLVAGQTDRTLEVVGVVADVLEAGYQRIDWMSEPQRLLYVPYQRWGTLGGMTNWRMSKWFLVRGAAPPEVLAPELRRAIWDVDPELPIDYIGSLEGMVDDGTLPQRSLTSMLLAFALVGVLLAATGVYGLTAYSVASRTREIGIRRALGATPWRVEGLFMRRAAVLGAVGIGVGTAGALALARFLRGMLYGVRQRDPLTLLFVATLLLGISLLATLIPARRAARVDPVTAIRCE